MRTERNAVNTRKLPRIDTALEVNGSRRQRYGMVIMRRVGIALRQKGRAAILARSSSCTRATRTDFGGATHRSECLFDILPRQQCLFDA